jgi:uncharacterized membrane protein
MRSLMTAAVASIAVSSFASNASAAFDTYNRPVNPVAANTHTIGSASTGGGGGKAVSAGGGGGGGKIAPHCAPGARGRACHRP